MCSFIYEGQRGYSPLTFYWFCCSFFINLKVCGAKTRWPFTDSAVPSSLLLRSARLCRQTFMFLFCLFCIKVCPTLCIIILLSSALSSNISVICYPISLKLCLMLVLNKETKWYHFQLNPAWGRNRAWSQSFTTLHNRKNSIYRIEIRTSLSEKNFNEE